MTFEDKAKEEVGDSHLNLADSARLLGMAYIADAIYKGLKRIAKVVDNLTIEVQDEE